MAPATPDARFALGALSDDLVNIILRHATGERAGKPATLDAWTLGFVSSQTRRVFLTFLESLSLADSRAHDLAGLRFQPLASCAGLLALHIAPPANLTDRDVAELFSVLHRAGSRLREFSVTLDADLTQNTLVLLAAFFGPSLTVLDVSVMSLRRSRKRQRIGAGVIAAARAGDNEALAVVASSGFLPGHMRAAIAAAGAAAQAAPAAAQLAQDLVEQVAATPAVVISAYDEMEQAEATQAEATKTGAAQAEAKQAEATQAEETQAEATQIEAAQVEATQAEATHAEAAQAKAAQAEASEDATMAGDPAALAESRLKVVNIAEAVSNASGHVSTDVCAGSDAVPASNATNTHGAARVDGTIHMPMPQVRTEREIYAEGEARLQLDPEPRAVTLPSTHPGNEKPLRMALVDDSAQMSFRSRGREYFELGQMPPNADAVQDDVHRGGLNLTGSRHIRSSRHKIMRFRRRQPIREYEVVVVGETPAEEGAFSTRNVPHNTDHPQQAVAPPVTPSRWEARTLGEPAGSSSAHAAAAAAQQMSVPRPVAYRGHGQGEGHQRFGCGTQDSQTAPSAGVPPSSIPSASVYLPTPASAPSLFTPTSQVQQALSTLQRDRRAPTVQTTSSCSSLTPFPDLPDDLAKFLPAPPAGATEPFLNAVITDAPAGRMDGKGDESGEVVAGSSAVLHDAAALNEVVVDNAVNAAHMDDVPAPHPALLDLANAAHAVASQMLTEAGEIPEMPLMMHGGDGHDEGMLAGNPFVDPHMLLHLTAQQMFFANGDIHAANGGHFPGDPVALGNNAGVPGGGGGAPLAGDGNGFPAIAVALAAASGPDDFEEPVLGDDYFIPFVERCRNLKSVKLDGARHLTDEGMRVLRTSEVLECLDLTGLPLVTDASLVPIIGAALRLKKLAINNVGRVTNLSIDAIGSKTSGGEEFTVLKVSNNPHITDASMRVLVNNCENLQSVTIKNCSNLTDHSVSHLSCSRNMQVLELNMTRMHPVSNRSTMFLGCAACSLRELSLSDCKKLTVDGIVSLSKLPKLEALQLLGISSVSQDSMRVLGGSTKQSFSRLEKLVLSGSLQLTSLGLNLLCCHSGHRVRHLVLLDEAKSLLDDALEIVGTWCSALRFLNLSGSFTKSAVRNLRLALPNLFVEIPVTSFTDSMEL